MQLIPFDHEGNAFDWPISSANILFGCDLIISDYRRKKVLSAERSRTVLIISHSSFFFCFLNTLFHMTPTRWDVIFVATRFDYFEMIILIRKFLVNSCFLVTTVFRILHSPSATYTLYELKTLLIIDIFPSLFRTISIISVIEDDD